MWLITSLVRIDLQRAGSYIASRHSRVPVCVSCSLSTTLLELCDGWFVYQGQIRASFPSSLHLLRTSDHPATPYGNWSGILIIPLRAAVLLEILWQGEAFALGQVTPATREDAAEEIGEAARADITAARGAACLADGP